MRTFLTILILVLIQGCIAYPGTYYYPESKNGKIISIGSCGDNSLSKLIIENNDIKISTQAGDVQWNYDQTWIWFEVNSDKKFNISVSPSTVSFASSENAIAPHEVTYSYRISDKEWFSEDYTSVLKIPSDTVKTTYFRIMFRFKKQENINLNIRGLEINSNPVDDIDVNFKKKETIRLSALNC
ncbi:hypothetical protein EZV61_13660 [Corallincola luteus]|uniref:Lipoprotein n=1 Tax=Corallincola luteus TaxID=1775177 RepID=A0ABY2AIE6_9GAMM|nr:hypothetical protein [Corallincola luteus]TCI02399.1 hypothetical protein EZV61_13660 [Corallincola luteus]